MKMLSTTPVVAISESSLNTILVGSIGGVTATVIISVTTVIIIALVVVVVLKRKSKEGRVRNGMCT